MKQCVTLCVFVAAFLFANKVSSQQIVTLSHPPEDTLSASFFIKDIIDARTDKAAIGLISQKDSLVTFNLKDGLRNSLMSYCDYAILPKEGQTEIVLQIDEFKVTNQSGTQAGLVEMNITFLTQTDSGNYRLFEYNLRQDIAANENVALMVETAVRLGIQRALAECKMYSEDSALYLQQHQQQGRFFIPKAKSPVLLETYEPIPRVSFLILFGGSIGQYSTGAHLSVLHFRDIPSQRWQIAGRYTYDKLFNVKPTNTVSSLSQAELYYVKIGLQPMYAISKRLKFYFPMQLPLGVEVLTKRVYYDRYETSKTLLMGLQFGAGLCFISKAPMGVYIGMHISQMVSTSLVYNREIAGQLDLGIKF